MNSPRGDFALVACENGTKHLELIKEHLIRICRKRKEEIEKLILERKNEFDRRNDIEQKQGTTCNILDSLLPHEQREWRFVNYVLRFGIDTIGVDKTVFSDTEIRIRFLDSVRGKDLFIIQNTYNPEKPQDLASNQKELSLLAQAAKINHALTVTSVLPYFNYSKADRKGGRESVGVAEAIKEYHDAGMDGIITMDMHNEQSIAAAYVLGMAFENIYVTNKVLMDFKRRKKTESACWGAPDVGAAKIARHYHKVTGLPLILAYKSRRVDSKSDKEAHELLGDVEDMDIYFCDDQIATGGTVMEIAEIAKKKKKARSVSVYVTHGLMLNDAFERFQKLKDEGVIDEIVIANTIIHDPERIKKYSFVKVLDVMDFFAKVIYETHILGSVTSLYDPKLQVSQYGKGHRAINGTP
jgi:ribose-phosphate pyrophosphokinase